MAIKVLISALGQHLIADVKSVSNRETEELVAYWVTEPRSVSYLAGENGDVNIRLGSPCPIAITTEYGIASSHIVSVLDPNEQILEYYNREVNPEPSNVVVGEAPTFEEVVSDNKFEVTVEE